MPTEADAVLSESEVAEIEARASTATEGPWSVWDSCSWRRIGTTEPFRDGNVICPITQNDGHPDLLARREDLEFIAHAREDIPALCATVKALRAEIYDERKYSDKVALQNTVLEQRLAQCEGSRRVHELDNHHNALACGYCAGPLKDELMRLKSILEKNCEH